MDAATPDTFTTDGPRDISAIKAEHWPRRKLSPIPKGRVDGFQVIFQQNALDAIHAHGKSITDIEICGFLIGNIFRDKRGPFLHITGSVEGRHATHHAAQVTFTSATWDYAHEVLERDHAGDRIVGWYHTHPDFGVFLSGMDLFIQDNFFNLPWQVALVYDPIRGDEGVFVWRKGVSERIEHLVYAGEYERTQAVAVIIAGEPVMPRVDVEEPILTDEPRSPSLLRRCLVVMDRFFDE